MEDNETINPIENNNLKGDVQFKKARAAYLAQRNARKKEAELMIKMERGHSSSSDDDPPPIQKLSQTIKFEQNQEDTKTNSSKDSKPKTKLSPFREERQRYRAERAAHRQQFARNKEVEFGPSSSDDDESDIQAYKSQVTVCQTATKVRKGSYKEELEKSPVPLEMTRSQKLQKQSNLQASARLKVEATEKKTHRERHDIEVPSKKGVNIWLQQFIQFKQNSIEIAERAIPIYDIDKTKLFFTKTQSGNYKMKVTCKNEDILFAVNHKKLNELCLDNYYYILAKIVTLKLQLMGKKISQQSKPNLVLNEKQLKGAQISGKVRKSSFFGSWQQSVGVVNQSGLCIFKQGRQKPALVIGSNSIRELWTRFQFDSENLIIKFLHNNSKVELSIPVQNFMSRDNWLYHVYNLAYK